MVCIPNFTRLTIIRNNKYPPRLHFILFFDILKTIKPFFHESLNKYIFVCMKNK